MLVLQEGQSQRPSLHDDRVTLGCGQPPLNIRAHREFGVGLSQRGSDRVCEASVDIAGWFHGNEPAADSTTEALGPGSHRDDADGGRAMRFAGCGR